MTGTKKPLAELIRNHFAPAAVGFACALPLAVMAQQAAPSPATGKSDKEKDTVLPEVKVTDEGFKKDTTSTATRTETPLRDIPQFINTIPETLIRSQNATQLSEALRNVPGISYAAGEGGTQANQVFYLRGFPAGGDLFIDGVRDIGEYNRDLFATESVDVLQGPSALMFGRGSTGGLVNQVSKVADLVARKEGALTVGSFDQKRLTADINQPFGESNAFRVIALGEKSGSYRYPQDVERAGIAPSVRFNIGYPTEITASYYYLKTHDITDYGQPTVSPAVTGTGLFEMPPISPRNYYGYANHDFTDHQTQIGTLRVDHRVGRDFTLRNVTRYAQYERQLEATISTLRNTDRDGAPLTPATPIEDLMVTRNHDGNRTRDNDDRAFINQTDVTWKLATGRVKHTVIGGLELAREKLDRWNYVLDADPNTPGTQTPTSATPLTNPDPSTTLGYTKTPNIRARAQGDTVGMFVQDQMELTNTLKALAGIRFERYEADARTESIATGAVAAGPFARTDRMTSYRAGLIWQPGATQSYYLAAGNSYNPSGELGAYGSTGTNLSVGNENVGPEENRGYELGGTWDFRDGMQLRAALFRNEKVNTRLVDVDGVVTLAGSRRVDGVEVQLAGHIMPNWEIYSGIAFMDAKILVGPANVQGKTPLGVADVSGNVWTTYKLGGGWEVGGGARYNSSFWLNDANTGKVPRYAVWDATLAYVRSDCEVRLNLYNLGDKTYYVGGYQNNPNRVLPGAPRQVSVTFRYTFD
jgi:catecholate siderophore receptor